MYTTSGQHNSRTATYILLTLCLSMSAICNTLDVGNGFNYATLSQATSVCKPGDTILVHAGTYAGGQSINNLQGSSAAWIYILTAPSDLVIYNGGSNAWQLTDARYVLIRGFTFQQQTGNGFNIDDGGSFDSPSHHIIFDSCTFRNINATGNNDLLKMSGIDDFEVRNCIFLNGSAGGSGVDMVGCHDGVVRDCRFENQGSNSIQMKGGTRNIRVERNFFKNGGQRSLNMGGSTGLAFFRPTDIGYEAAELKVYSNVFIGSDAPIAFVGCINSEVINNTIVMPTRWVMRILQETVDASRFAPCGRNTFRNNIIYRDNRVSTDCNVGPNTAPETFTFSNNLWFHSQNASWPGPTLPVQDNNSIVGQNPMFVNITSENFDISSGSPAIAKGFSVVQPSLDYNNRSFQSPRSIGAFEGNSTVGIDDAHYVLADNIMIYPNPSSTRIHILLKDEYTPAKYIEINNILGATMHLQIINKAESTLDIDISNYASGVYVVKVFDGQYYYTKSFVVQ